MITEHDLQEAIAECQGVLKPNASTCIKLAAFLTIQRELYGKKDEELSVPMYSYSSQADNINYSSDTEFSKAIVGLSQDAVMKVMDELMSTLFVVQPRLYASVLRKIQEIA